MSFSRKKNPKYVIFEIWLISCVIYYKLLYKLFSRRLIIYGSLKIATTTYNPLNINAFILFNYLSQQKMNYSTISNFMKSVNRRLVIHPSFFFSSSAGEARGVAICKWPRHSNMLNERHFFFSFIQFTDLLKPRYNRTHSEEGQNLIHVRQVRILYNNVKK